MPSSFLRLVGLVALVYFVFWVPIGRQRTLADHAREFWATTEVHRAFAAQCREIKGELLERVRHWRASQQPQAIPEDAQHQTDGDGDGISTRPVGPSRKARSKKSRGRHDDPLPAAGNSF